MNQKNRMSGLLVVLILYCIALIVPISTSAGIKTSEYTEIAHELFGQGIENAYIKKYLELYNIEARYMKSRSYGIVPGVLFKIKNKGKRQLNRVEVTVYFKDKEANIIFEQAFYPVAVSKWGDDNPLKPGYIWQVERGKFFPSKSAPDEWEEGSVEAKITDIEFSD